VNKFVSILTKCHAVSVHFLIDILVARESIRNCKCGLGLVKFENSCPTASNSNNINYYVRLQEVHKNQNY